ncbi:hypothetical protein K1T71_007823 [Dendrolimus kikuchii]|uniref:Uncharacterized protein n=1 Tax=Dendrolimus kikuchii TaxID=765133 RepID=A0ACC1CY88_9NEOP|nr:hypothetical protein K1T71_007823 [Dendrolimus kikuchii]
MQLVSARLQAIIVQRYVFKYKKQNPPAHRTSNFSQPDAVLLSTTRNAASGQLLIAPASPAATRSFCGLATSIKPTTTLEGIRNRYVNMLSLHTGASGVAGVLQVPGCDVTNID